MPGEAGLTAARARQAWSPVVAMVGIEPVGDGLSHGLQRHPPGFGLDCLEVIRYALADQPLDLDYRSECMVLLNSLQT